MTFSLGLSLLWRSSLLEVLDTLRFTEILECLKSRVDLCSLVTEVPRMEKRGAPLLCCYIATRVSASS